MKKTDFTHMAAALLYSFFFILIPCWCSADEFDVESFTGFFLCDSDTVTDEEKQQVMTLTVEDDGTLRRTDRLYVSTPGTTLYYDYTGYQVDGNSLICSFDCAIGSNGIDPFITPGTHTFVLMENGDLLEGDTVWHKKPLRESGEPADGEGVLLNVDEVDFEDGSYDSSCSFLGNKKMKRKNVEQVILVNDDTSIPKNAWDISADGDESVMAWSEKTGWGRYKILIKGTEKVIANKNSASLFRGCRNLVYVDITQLDTSYTSTMAHMFEGCSALETIDGIDKIDTISVTDMNAMFSGCSSLQSLDLKSFDTSNVNDMSYMFEGCSTLESLDLDNFNTKHVTDMRGMFMNCSSLDSLQNYKFHFSKTYTGDMYTGTKWEGTSPHFESFTDRTLRASYIMGLPAYLKDAPAKRVEVINQYDSKISYLYGGWGNGIEKVMYALEDLDGNNIPELILKVKEDGGYIYRIFRYDVISCDVNELDNSNIETEDTEFYFSEKERKYFICPNYETFNGVERYRLMNLYGDSEEDDLITMTKAADRGYKKAVFLYAENEELKEFKYDMDGDGADEDFVVYGEKGYEGFTHLVIFAGYDGCYSTDIPEGSYSWEISYETLADKLLTYIRFYNPGGTTFCRLLELKGDRMIPVVDLNELVSEDQLESRDPLVNKECNYFTYSIMNNTTLCVTLELDTIAFGGKGTFEENLGCRLYYRYSDEDAVNGRSSFTPLTRFAGFAEEELQIPSPYYTAINDIDVYQTPSLYEKSFVVHSGERITIDRLFFFEGTLWARIVTKDHDKGWIPAGNKKLFLEVDKNTSDQGKTDEGSETGSEIEDYPPFIFHESDDLHREYDYWLSLIKPLQIDKASNLKPEEYEYAWTILRMMHDMDMTDEEGAEIVDDYFDNVYDWIKEDINAEDYQSAYEYMEQYKWILKLKKDFRKYWDICVEALGISDEPSDNDTSVEGIVQIEHRFDETTVQLLDELKKNTEDPIWYCVQDLDGDGADELIVRSPSVYMFREMYSYDIYTYDASENTYELLQESAFLTGRSEDLVWYWESTGYLLVKSYSSDSDYVCYTMQDGILTAGNTAEQFPDEAIRLIFTEWT